jgi:predicted aspartyl protease
MRRVPVLKLLAVALPLLVAACAEDAPGDCRLVHVTDLSLLPRDRMLVTPALLNDQPTNLVLDTGSFATIITRPAADRLHLSLQGTAASVTGIGGSQSLYTFIAHSFRIGELHGTGLLMGASAVGMDTDRHPFDGILGADFLSRYEIDFDLPERKLRLFKIVAGCARPAANLDEPLYLAKLARPANSYDLQPHVIVVIDGIRLNAILDSGAQTTSIFRNAARRLGLRLEDLKTDARGHMSGVGPATRASVRHIMAPITIGEITVSNLPVSIIDQRSDDEADMLLGLDFFARVHVWLSFRSGSLIMQYPAKPSPKLAG